MDKNKISKADFGKICRICLQMKENLSSEHRTELFDKLNYSIGIEFEQDDNLPNSFCQCCMDQINSMYDFKELCLSSQQILSEVLKNDSEQTAANIKDEDDAESNFSESNEEEYFQEFTDQILIDIKEENMVMDVSDPKPPIEDHDGDGDKSIDDTEVASKSISLMLTKLIKLHVEKLDGSDHYKCTICGKVCKMRYYLRKHMLLHIPREQRLKYCTICGKEYTRRDTYAKHLKDHEKESKRKGVNFEKLIFKCSECQRLFDNQDDLDKHKLIHIPKQSRTYECLECHRLFHRQDHLDKHKLVHIPKKNRTRHCLYCDKYYLREDTFQRHIKIHENGKELCKICGKSYLQLNHHIVRVHSEKSYNCTQCNSKFSRQYYLDKHVKDVHQDIKNKKNYLHLCPHCGKRFEGLGFFQSHVASHEGRKLFECKVCNREFSFKTNLRNHMRHHQLIVAKNFHCLFCDKRFRLRGSLKAHIRTHTGERPYSCKICERAFAQRSSLRTHMKTHDLQEMKV